MNAKKLKLLSLGVAGVLLITSIAVFAADGNSIQGKRGMRKGIGIQNMLTDEQIAEMKADRLAKLKESLDKQVADGKITQEKADEIYANCESGDFKGIGMGFGRQQMKNLTDEEIAQMKAERLAKLKENLDKQVADGKITQEKADEIYANCESGDFKGIGMGLGRQQNNDKPFCPNCGQRQRAGKMRGNRVTPEATSAKL